MKTITTENGTIHKNEIYCGEKIEYEDGIGCCIWETIGDDDFAGCCFDFSFKDIDDLIGLLVHLKSAPAEKFIDPERKTECSQ